MLDCKGVNLPWVYMSCSIYIKTCHVWCSGNEGIHARLQGEVHLPWVYVQCSAIRCAKLGVVVFKASMLK